MMGVSSIFVRNFQRQTSSSKISQEYESSIPRYMVLHTTVFNYLYLFEFNIFPMNSVIWFNLRVLSSLKDDTV